METSPVKSKREPLFTVKDKDLEVQTFCAGGKGGQNQNKRFTGVRIIHRASGAVGECREERDQLQNKRIALKRLSETVKFKLWVNRQVYELDHKQSIEKEVDASMKPENLLVEVKSEDGKWTPEQINDSRENL